MSKPITPSEVEQLKATIIPDAVFDAFNEAIAKAWDGRSATVKQADVVRAIALKLEINSSEVFDRGYLEIESIYRKAGWKVIYDKPGYNETGDAYFEFSKK